MLHFLSPTGSARTRWDDAAANLSIRPRASAFVARTGPRKEGWLLFGLLAISCGLVAFCWSRTDDVILRLPETLVLCKLPGQSTWTLYTDRNSAISVYLNDEIPNAALETSFLQSVGIDVSPVESSSTNPACNCHGWVFTGGRFTVDGEFVDGILIDNGYRMVTKPGVGDLIIYRDEVGEIMHSGLVRDLDCDGRVLVESKFGMFGRYVHRADIDWCDGQSVTYYRSPRDGHLLAGLNDRIQAKLGETAVR